MTIVVVVIENTFCRASECYVYTGPDNETTRQKAIKGFIQQIEEIQGKLNPDQEAHYLEKKYYPGSYYTVCIVDGPEVHAETDEEKKVRLAKEKRDKEKKERQRDKEKKEKEILDLIP